MPHREANFAFNHVNGMRQSVKEHILSLSRSVADICKLNIPFCSFTEESAKLDVLVAALDEPCFRIGVTGEFSAGKSAFINAMIERRCLAEDIIQGTTRLPVVLKNSKNEFIRVMRRDGTCLEFASKGATDEETRRFLEAVSASDEAEDNVEVVWESDFFLPGMALVDMPGFCSLDAAHDAIARNAACSCDVLIVVVNINSPLGSGLLREMEILTGPDATGCVFVGTFADQLTKKQLEKMEKFLSDRLKRHFGRDCHLFFVSSVEALEDLENCAHSGAALDRFRKVRAELLADIKKSAPLFRSAMVAWSGSQMAAGIGKRLWEAKKRIDNQIDESNEKNLNSAGMPEMKERTLHFFEKECARNKDCILRAAEAEIESFRDAVIARINGFSGSAELNKYIKDELPGRLEDFSIHYQKKFRIMLADKLEQAFKNNLARLPENCRFSGERSLSADMEPRTRMASLSRALKDLASGFETEENYKIGGGFGLGLGLAILVPGIGWLACGLLTTLTTFLGAGWLTSLESLKKKYKAEIRANFGDIGKEALHMLERTYDSAAGAIGKELGQMADMAKKRIQRELLEHVFKLRNMSARIEEYGAEMEKFSSALADAALQCQLAADKL